MTPKIIENSSSSTIGENGSQLDRIESLLVELVRQKTIRAWYTVEELAAIVEKAPFTVREWCRNGRLNAEKRGSGRGANQEWVVSHDELLRYQRHGLLSIVRAQPAERYSHRRSTTSC